MLRSFWIGSLFGIPVKLDVTFLLILPIFAWIIAVQIADLVPMVNGVLGTEIRAGPLTTGSAPWILGTAAAIGLFASVLLHELVTVVDQIDPHRRRFHLRETDAVEIPRSRNVLELPLETFELLLESFEWIASVGHNALHGCSVHPQIVPYGTG
jgi:hypothetical protein